MGFFDETPPQQNNFWGGTDIQPANFARLPNGVEPLQNSIFDTNQIQKDAGIFDLGNNNKELSFWENPSIMKNISTGIGTVGTLANTYLGFQQLGQAKDQLSFQKEAFWSNYNQQVADREEAARRRNIAAGRV